MQNTLNHFALFGLSQSYEIDASQLEQAWKRAQLQVHPDRFSAASATEKRVAVQWATQINEAYTLLRCPLKRAAYMCELAGYPIDAENNTSMSLDFLEQQMEWRDALARAHQYADIGQVVGLRQQLTEAKGERLADLKKYLSLSPDYTQAVRIIREWMFIEKFSDEIEAIYALLSEPSLKA